VFARALGDPVEAVRHTALHSIACERCGDGELCLSDVVPRLVEVLATDPAVEMRHKAIPVLLGLADRDALSRGAPPSWP
jgi:HEAT repeat protein